MDRSIPILRSTLGLSDSHSSNHASPLLSLHRREAILIIGIRTITWLASEINTRKSMENFLLSTRLCVGSGEWTISIKWCWKDTKFLTLGILGKRSQSRNVICTGVVLRSTGTGFLTRYLKQTPMPIEPS